MQGQYPFNEAAFKHGLRKGFQLGLLFAALLAAIVSGLIRDAHAETEADRNWGQWVRVTPQTMLQPVPETRYGTATPGAVTNEYRNLKPLPATSDNAPEARYRRPVSLASGS
jgi:hypothetical protein